MTSNIVSNSTMNELLVVAENNTSRKRITTKSKRELAKKNRYVPKSLPVFPLCGHKGKPQQPYQCSSLLTMRDIKHFHDAFFKKPDKIAQDHFILKHCTTYIPKRARKRKEENNKPKSLSVSYYVKRKDGLLVHVCRQTFMGILGVKKDRILNILKRYKNENQMPLERRGGDRTKGKNNNKRAAIKTFVESLTCIQSHYCRSKTAHRFYLPAELSIRELWRMYNNRVNLDLQVKESFFRYLFVRTYNVGFGTPKTDLCSTCLQFQEKIKTVTDPGVINALTVQQRLHKIRANVFYEFLKENQENLEVVMFSFDCQKNLALPKIPDQAAYFSMQLNFYHFAVVEGSSKGKLNQHTVRSYVWTELDHPRGSNEIASALYHVLTTYEFSDTVKTIRLFCDGCGAQNKNSIVIGMLSNWLLNASPPNIENVDVIFPVVGHSYIPPDRLFGQIEKLTKRKPEITCPEDYIKIIEKWGKVIKLGVDAPVFDWKTKVQGVLKPPSQWHFKFQLSKRILISKSDNGYTIRGESMYKNNVRVLKTPYYVEDAK
ncbi:hypothetical protein RI129_010877 [Pyrocoelia pectoralis]|uniref:DUF7869 domain-containing protein n=1 Tax=Pyrocoelia pectoralis TaxID=417401 RepID=A0AAN7V7T0_9COLE